MAKPGFSFEIATRLPADEAWRRIVDVSRHGDVVPFTTGSGPEPWAARVGSRYVARTALGPVGFDDVMVVRALEPGGSVVFEKVGRLVGGTVDVRVSGSDDGPTRVRWHQDLELPWVPRVLTPASDVILRSLGPMVRWGYRRVVAALLDANRARGR